MVQHYLPSLADERATATTYSLHYFECGTTTSGYQLKFARGLATADKAEVTCKRCLKGIAREEAGKAKNFGLTTIVHYNSQASAIPTIGLPELHKTTGGAGVNGLLASRRASEVTCQICQRKMLAR